MSRPIRERGGFRCRECGHQPARWVGRCPECRVWGSVEQSAALVAGRGFGAGGPGGGLGGGLGSGFGGTGVTVGSVSAPAKPIGEIGVEAARARPTGVGELDRVLGGGLVPGSVTLLAGEPGVGKSTLLLDVGHRFAETGRRSLIVTGEESAAQVRLRAERLGALDPRLFLAAETDLAALLSQVEMVEPELLIVDSVQTVASPVVDGTAGGVAQVRAVAAALIAAAKERAIATILVGHVTKDGAIAGPRILEHLVDVVLHFDGDRHSRLRLIRAVKNRFGPADEVGCFELDDRGMRELPDPSGLFVSRHSTPVPGTCVTVTLEGRRPLVAEVQALVSGSPAEIPRRAVSGVDASRTAMTLAVLQQRCGVPLGKSEVFAATVGGVRLTEPAADLALALAVASSARGVALPAGLVAVGEVGLAGDVRPIGGVARRLAEAARLGFQRALVPRANATDLATTRPAGIRVLEVDDLAEALRAALVC